VSKNKKPKYTPPDKLYCRPVLFSFIKSPAYKKISSNARTVYTICEMQGLDVKLGKADKFTLPYSLLAEYISNNSIKPAIEQLIQYGFIKLVEEGGHYERRKNNKTGRNHWKNAYYTFSNEWQSYNQDKKDIMEKARKKLTK
jgi:hypothetical protein